MHNMFRKTLANDCILLTLRKEIFTTAKYFNTSDIICFCKSLVVSTLLEAFLGFLVKTKIKAYTKSTVVMCFDRRSVAPYSDNFHWRLQVTAPAGAAGGGVAPR